MKKYYILFIIFNFFTLQSSDFYGYFSDSSGDESCYDRLGSPYSPDVTNSPSRFHRQFSAPRRSLFGVSANDSLSHFTLAVESTEQDDFDDVSIKLFKNALDFLNSQNVLNKTPQKRIPRILDKIYSLITGVEVQENSPLKKTPEKMAKLFLIHKKISEHIENCSDSAYLKLLSNSSFITYLNSNNCEIGLVDIAHIFEGDSKGGGHFYHQDDDQSRFEDEVSQLHINDKTGVVYGVHTSKPAHGTSIFPRHLTREDVFGIIRCSSNILCRQNNRILVQDENLLIEMYLQEEDMIVRSAFPIFAFVDLLDFKELDVVNIFSSDILSLDISYKDLIQNINKILEAIVSIKKIEDNGPIRYCMQDYFIVDIASLYQEKTNIKSGLYVKIKTDLLDSSLVEKVRAKMKSNSNNLHTPFSRNRSSSFVNSNATN